MNNTPWRVFSTASSSSNTSENTRAVRPRRALFYGKIYIQAQKKKARKINA